MAAFPFNYIFVRLRIFQELQMDMDLCKSLIIFSTQDSQFSF